MSDSTALKEENPQSSSQAVPRGSSLKLRDKIVLIASIIVLIFGLLVWARIEWGASAFQTAQLWIYQNYGVSKAWAFTFAVLAALLLTANLGFLVVAVLFARRKDVNRLLVVSALVLIPGTLVYELSNRDQCFNRTTEAPLCALYKKPDGTFVLHRVEDAEPPSTWQKVRTASREDVVRYGSSDDDRRKLRPTRITWETCGTGTEFFDSVSGDPKVFFAKIDNRFELFDQPGFHPQVNVRLEPVTVQSAREICKALTEPARLALDEKESHKKLEAVQIESQRLAALKSLINCTARATTAIAIKPASDTASAETTTNAAEQLARTVRASSMTMTTNFFRPKFFLEGYFDRAYGGDVKPLQEAGAFACVNTILLGQLESSCGQVVNEVMTCDLRLVYRVVDRNGRTLDSGSVSAAGPGFDKLQALQNGTKTLIETKSSQILRSIKGG